MRGGELAAAVSRRYYWNPDPGAARDAVHRQPGVAVVDELGENRA